MALESFWSACETLVGPAAVEVEWQRLAGEDNKAVRLFLRSTQELATTYPCLREHQCACSHRVIDHGNGDIVAVCQCNPPRCDKVHLSESDLVVYELNRPALDAAVADALSLQHAHADVAGLPWVTRIGFDSPCAGFRFPVYLVLTPSRERITSAVFTLAAMNVGSFVVIAPTGRKCEPASLDLLSSRSCLFLTLSDVLCMDECGLPAAAEHCATLLHEFHVSVVPALRPDSREASAIAFFPTPPNAAWSDVQILFRDGHTVAVCVRNESGVYNFAQMGMSKKNTATPTAQWELLEAFAAGHGVFDWGSGRASRNQKKQKQLLAQALCDFFRIEGDPFIYVARYKGWEALFEIGPCQ